MATYIDVPIETDPEVLSADAIDYLTTNIPGFVPREGHIEIWMLEVWARMVAEARDVASAVPVSIFRYFGRSLVGLAPVEGAEATTTTTWTMQDAQGYTVPAETVVGFQVTGDEVRPFVTTEDLVIEPGLTTGTVEVRAIDAGADANGLGPGPMLLVDSLSFVNTVAADVATSGGVDAETDDEYLDRLITELQLLAPRPILAGDFAVMARRVTGVDRAVALDTYDPNTNTYGNERTVAIAVVDENGDPLPQATKDEVRTYLDSLREVNFVVHVFDPTYTNIDVTFTAVAEPNTVIADVEAAAEETITEYLSPANWGSDNPTLREWRNETTVRYFELIGLLNDVPGLRYVTNLTLNGGTADVVLAGEVALPRPGIIDGTVT